MEHYAGNWNFSLELSSVCVVDAQGKIVRETQVASEPEALVAFFASLGFAVKRDLRRDRCRHGCMPGWSKRDSTVRENLSPSVNYALRIGVVRPPKL